MFREPALIGIILVSLIVLWLVDEDHKEAECQRAYQKLDECQTRYAYDTCKDLYLPTFCEDRD